MNVYDTYVEQCLRLLDGQPGKSLHVTSVQSNQLWPDAGENSFLLPSETAYELGGGNLPAVSGIGYTSCERLVGADELWLYGEDLPQLRADSAYARLTFLRLNQELPQNQEGYALLRKLEYTRYHVTPLGFQMRISTAQAREPVRIGRQALTQGLNFTEAGNLLLQAYHHHPQVAAVKMIFVTQPSFAYAALQTLFHKMEQVTESLDHIFRNLNMDCATCSLQEICDEVEELRELHFSRK